ncbi:hypothetical protein F889_00934 [Acinetobacter colistiniresistens]|uniref:Uncharacterized protein n=1 Tax=Acinetobacter colistiniresistens TaxID=280145 RepID=N9R7Y7_9GAMM|nr:hypothetical protein [Acinetobacter colistiniresistens]ENX35267.1 hypothetical protein F889_00934 [Acinetobacter colistiniresistens]UUM26415.1 hypothetical protein NQU59_11990 [Acinetobacter colistiniresistens]
MDMISRQTEILTNLLQIMVDSVYEDYDSLQGIFDYCKSPIDHSVSMEANFSYFIENNEKFVFMSDPESKIPYLLEELHRLVQEHTGGVWTKLILTLDENGRAHTKFIYDEKS